MGGRDDPERYIERIPRGGSTRELLPTYRKVKDQRYGQGHRRRCLVHSQPNRPLLFSANGAKSRGPGDGVLMFYGIVIEERRARAEERLRAGSYGESATAGHGKDPVDSELASAGCHFVLSLSFGRYAGVGAVIN